MPCFVVDELDRNTLTDMSKVCKQYIKQGRWGEAAGMFNKMINYFTTRTGLNFVYNYLLQGQPAPFSYYPKYLRLPKTRLAKKTIDYLLLMNLFRFDLLAIDHFQSGGAFMLETRITMM